MTNENEVVAEVLREHVLPQLSEDIQKTLTNHVITLEKSRSNVGVEVTCTCGEFTFGPTTKVISAGIAAFDHAHQTGHLLRDHREPA